MKEGEACKLISVEPKQHFTQPPPRYSEASIVKKWKNRYRSTINLCNNYSVYKIVSTFHWIAKGLFQAAAVKSYYILETFFQRCVEYDFTAQMEEKLDLISNGHADWKKELGHFWVPFFGHVNSVKQMTHDEVFSGIHDLVIDWFVQKKKKRGEYEMPCLLGGILKLNFGKPGCSLDVLTILNATIQKKLQVVTTIQNIQKV
ncbi:DNA topoisomerase 1 [Trichonephila clavata]|uniref:DNA topoisomerase 1 n=1 Tax=Trichonephila clavata TaxID=2740835 RepID=A0A8X6IR44_TRICU|nr:DNA topoisomerase 1 [Trichonephila clavata]